MQDECNAPLICSDRIDGAVNFELRRSSDVCGALAQIRVDLALALFARESFFTSMSEHANQIELRPRRNNLVFCHQQFLTTRTVITEITNRVGAKAAVRSFPRTP
jgi:hypothetical protein